MKTTAIGNLSRSNSGDSQTHISTNQFLGYLFACLPLKQLKAFNWPLSKILAI